MTQTNPQASPLLTYEQAAELLGVKPRMVRQLWERRQLAAVKVGNLVRFTADDIAEYVKRQRVEVDQ